MNIFSKIANLLSSPGRADSDALWVAVMCKRCGEVTRARVDLRNDLSIQYDEAGGMPTYFCRKVLMSEGGHCFQRMEVALTFDANRKLVNREVSGGEFVD